MAQRTIFAAVRWALTPVLLITTFVASRGDLTPQNVSSLYIDEAGTTFAFNYAPDSNDVNFYISAPDWYQYAAVGFGSSMQGSLMLVAYAAADEQHVTVSPRLGTGDSEPPHYSNVTIELDESSSIVNDYIVANGTCRNCRSWSGGSLDLTSTTQSFIYAVGPNVALMSDDLSAPLRRHIGFGHFTMNLVAATGPSGISSSPDNLTANAVMAGDVREDSDHKSEVHGVLFAILAIMLVPFDSLVALALRRWPKLHIVSSTVVLGFMAGGVATGIQVSGEYLRTKKFTTGHQVLGLVTFSFMVLNLLAGVLHGWTLAEARRRDPEAPRPSSFFGTFHTWMGRLVWLLLIVNNGLGLQLAAQPEAFIIGYSILIVAVVAILLPVYWCLWRLRRKERDSKDGVDEDAYQLSNMNFYDRPQH